MSALSPPDDRLVTRAASGDGAAFEDIFERYHQDLYRYALSIVRDPHDAQDVLQSTMERAMRSFAGQRVRGGLKAWLFGIAHNESMDALALGGALGATRSGEDPGVDKAAATEAPSDPRKAAPGDRPVGETSSAPPESASVSGYSSLDPSATTVLGEGGSGGDGSSRGATAADSGGYDAALAFTGLDVGLLAVAGLLLIGLGSSMRHTATRHV